MARVQRLTRADFLARKGAKRAPVHRFQGTYFTLTVTLPEESGDLRAGCVVSKRVAARAVDRNRVKRRCREAIRGAATLPQSGTLVFQARRGAADASFAEVRQDIEALCTQLAKAVGE